MTTQKDRRQQQAASSTQDYFESLPSDEALTLDAAGGTSLGAWFLGPKAENQEILQKMISDSIAEHCFARQATYPDDPVYITDAMRSSKEFQETLEIMTSELSKIGRELQSSTPFWSYRYQGHMNWDVTLPAIAGYVAAMLYNQNNVAAEGSPVTTWMELQVGQDLCRMLGFPNADGKSAGLRPWAHITCDGSVANLEAMWYSRNLKYWPVAVKQALLHESSLLDAKGFVAETCSGARGPLVEMSDWELLNIKGDDIVELTLRIQSECGIEPETMSSAVNKYSLQQLGFAEFYRRFLPNTPAAVLCSPSDNHYSWPKNASIIGVGQDRLLPVRIDEDARMVVHRPEGSTAPPSDTDPVPTPQALESHLEACLRTETPVIMVVDVHGSTEEGAVDPLVEVLEIRRHFRDRGLDFVIHVDAAWGGYYSSILRGEQPSTLTDYSPAVCMSSYVEEQIRALGQVDSITIDPHKSGFIPYPAGGMCYRNGSMRNMVTFKAPVVYHGGVDPDVGVYGVEGSKPGAAAAATYLSHRVIRTDSTGYGKLLGKSLFNSKRLYSAIVTLGSDSSPFVVVPVQMTPAARSGKNRQEQDQELDFIRERIVKRSNSEILSDGAATKLIRELGSDLAIVAFAFNYRSPDGSINADISKANALNDKIFSKLSNQTRTETLPQMPYFVTQSAFDTTGYGTEFVGNFARRLCGTEAKVDQAESVSFLISTTMDPWIAETSDGNFIPELMMALEKTVEDAIDNIWPQQ